MKVRELIERLEEMPQEAELVVCIEDGDTVTGVRESVRIKPGPLDPIRVLVS